MKRPRQNPLTIVSLSVLAMALTTGLVQAQESQTPVAGQRAGKRQDTTAIIIVEALDEDSQPFLDTLKAALINEFKSAGFRVYSDKSDTAETKAEPRWLVSATCHSYRNRLIWRMTVTDNRDGAMSAGLNRAAFAGISAIPQLEESAAMLALSAASHIDRSTTDYTIGYALRFNSPDEGATLYLGSDQNTPLGVITDGTLLAPYEPFESGKALVLSVTKPGYWTHVQTSAPNESDLPIDLAALMVKTRHSLSVGIAAGRLAGANAEYRYSMAPDALFLRIGLQAWSRPALTPKELPIMHEELRLGLGSYIIFPRNSAIRLALGTGVFGTLSTMHSPELARKAYFDLGLEAAFFSLEWHWPRIAVYIEQRAAYSFGLESGLLRRGWIGSASYPMLVSTGVIFKWQ